jgi:hypothetical protein
MDAAQAVVSLFQPPARGRQPGRGGRADLVTLLRDALAAVEEEGLSARVQPRIGGATLRSPGQRNGGRVIHTVDYRIRLGSAATIARAADPSRGWLQRFVEQTWGCPATDPGSAMLRMRVSRAVTMHERAQEGNPRGREGRGHRPAGVRTERVRPCRRLRCLGIQGRPQMLEDLSHELFQWWTDMAITLQARVSSESTKRQAEIIRADAERFIAECDLNGVTVSPEARRLPTISWVWIHRWRK